MTARDPRAGEARAPDPTELDAEPVGNARTPAAGSEQTAVESRLEQADAHARAEQADVGGRAGQSHVDTLAERVVRALIGAGASVATAESLTGGLVCAALTSVPGASAVVFGGVASYSTDLKIRVLGVPAEVIAEHGTVAAETALRMADGVRELTGATVGVATTGVAGPDAIEGQPVGTVFVAVTRGVSASGPHRESEREVRALSRQGSREQVRQQSVVAALELMAEMLSGPDNGA